MLRYLAAQPVPPKEYGIGVEVFDRGPAFDPRTDNIVRVQARNLRARLQEYYLGEGAQDRSRIELPKGSYALQSRPVTVARPHSFHKTMAVAALLAAVAVLFSLWLYPRFNGHPWRWR